jgi:hypothetical protein
MEIYLLKVMICKISPFEIVEVVVVIFILSDKTFEVVAAA